MFRFNLCSFQWPTLKFLGTVESETCWKLSCCQQGVYETEYDTIDRLLEFNVPFQHKYGYIRDEYNKLKVLSMHRQAAGKSLLHGSTIAENKCISRLAGCKSHYTPLRDAATPNSNCPTLSLGTQFQLPIERRREPLLGSSSSVCTSRK